MPTQPEIRYLTSDELARLRRYAEARGLQATQDGAVTAVREWALLDTLLSSGLRAAEVAALCISDALLGYGQASLLVRHGKGDKAREVFISEDLKRHLKAFITWKRDRGEDVADAAPLFTGQRGALTRNGVWRAVKSLMASVGLDPRYATHSCRHSYAVALYRASGADLEVVQEQLGHADVKTTQIYARITKEDKKRAADALAKVYRDSQQKGTSVASWPRRAPVSAGIAA
jgi:site-specific recombinase XerD